MRRGARRAVAALAALALAAPGCKPSSLTPFGLGTRGPDPGLAAHSGAWAGRTANSGSLTFVVVSGEVQDFIFEHVTDTCTVSFTIDATTGLIEEDAFVLKANLDPQGWLTIEGRFTSPDTATGRYSFGSRSASSRCPVAGTGSFTAEKLPPAN
ncbi:MAG TPA: hypothetical protein VN317_02475 [Candidatus Methanoperedens sp.]|nr:hypothetical protein [Candidatus Methanoperedens sp.]